MGLNVGPQWALYSGGRGAAREAVGVIATAAILRAEGTQLTMSFGEKVMPLETRYEHIVLDDSQQPMLAGTTMKVKELVAERLAWGWSAEELLINHPDLTLGKIYSALAYYADHQDEIDAAIDADMALSDHLRQITEPSPLVARLKTLVAR